jgi:hypothetical protein
MIELAFFVFFIVKEYFSVVAIGVLLWFLSTRKEERISKMNQVNLKKKDLLDKLRDNRDAHESLYNEAMLGYQEHLKAILQDKLARLEEGEDIDADIPLVKPVNMLNEYDQAIQMLEMSVDKIISLNHNEFASYVMDEWGWKKNFIFTNSAYLNQK